MPTENNKRIAKNTIALYIRMLLIVLVTLYTSRVVLQTLGVIDFGIYSLVSGVVIMFSFISNALATSTQRFLSYEIGHQEKGNVDQIFSISAISCYALAVIIVLITEVVGMWFINNKLNIPYDKLDTAIVVFHISMISLFVQIISTPYNAIIIAYEKMNIYAYISIFEVATRLMMVYLLFMIDNNKLIVYAILMCMVSVSVRLVYTIYCKRYLCNCAVSFKQWNIEIFKKIFGFSSWSIIGCFADIWTIQGINVILNLFFGVVINTATGISMQISNAVNQFVGNFQTAFRPQIVKYYASHNIESFVQLVFRTSRISYYLLFIVALPVLLCMNQILHIWLGSVPEYTAIFGQLIIISLLFDALSGPFWISAQAIGNIRNYQITLSTILLLNLPIAYIFLYCGAAPYIVFAIKIMLNIIALIYRVLYVRSKVHFDILIFVKEVLGKVILVTATAVPLPIVFALYTDTNLINGIYTIIFTLLITSISIFVFGLNNTERDYVKQTLRLKTLNRE